MGGRRRHTILAIDADRDMVREYTRILAGGYRVISVSSGGLGLNLVQVRDDVELVLVDIRLPDRSGLAVLKDVKKLRPDIPVIVVTAIGSEEMAVLAFRYGARDYLRKPVDGDDLRTRIAFYLMLKYSYIQPRRSLYHDDGELSSMTALLDTASRYIANVQKVVDFVAGNPTAKVSLSAAAKRACLSMYHFSRIFKKTAGMTYQEYVIRCRVERAKAYLKDVHRNITETAHLVGYSNVNNLTRIFKKLTGFTPSEFRSLNALSNSCR